MQRTQDKFLFARRRMETYWGTATDDNDANKDLDKLYAQVIYRQFLTTQLPKTKGVRGYVEDYGAISEKGKKAVHAYWGTVP